MPCVLPAAAQMLSSIATLMHDTYLPLFMSEVLQMSNTKASGWQLPLATYFCFHLPRSALLFSAALPSTSCAAAPSLEATQPHKPFLSGLPSPGADGQLACAAAVPHACFRSAQRPPVGHAVTRQVGGLRRWAGWQFC